MSKQKSLTRSNRADYRFVVGFVAFTDRLLAAPDGVAGSGDIVLPSELAGKRDNGEWREGVTGGLRAMGAIRSLPDRDGQPHWQLINRPMLVQLRARFTKAYPLAAKFAHAIAAQSEGSP
jgi:hypothetical protein